MERLMFTNNDSSTELAWEILKKEQACWHTDYCTVSCEECENYVIHRDLERAIDIIIEENKSAELKTVRDTLNSMTDDEFADWLCHQIFPDYAEDNDADNILRYKTVMNFLKMDIKQAKEGNRW